MVYLTNLFVITVIALITPTFAVPSALDPEAQLVARARRPFKPQSSWFRPVTSAWKPWKKLTIPPAFIRPIAPKPPIPPRLSGLIAKRVRRDLEGDLVDRATEESLLIARDRYDNKVLDPREYEDALEVRDNAASDGLQTREYLTALVREYVDPLEAREFDDDGELEARDISDELFWIREPAPEY